MDERAAAYDEVADAYSRARDPDGAGLVDPVLQELVGDVAGLDVLSLACGQGHDARLLAGLGARVTGLDISPEMLRHACEHEASAPRGIEYLQGDAKDLPFEDERFDGVVCHLALVDMPELSPAIASVARVLRAGGWFVFSIVHPCYPPHVANIDDYLLDHRYDKQAPPDWLPKHAYHRPLGQIVDELVGVGFRIERLVEVHRLAEDEGGIPRFLYARCVYS